jgi:hypothetical protein
MDPKLYAGSDGEYPIRRLATEMAPLAFVGPACLVFFLDIVATNPISDRKPTIDLSPNRISHISADLQAALMPHGLANVLDFFNAVTARQLCAGLHLAISTVGIKDLFLCSSPILAFQLFRGSLSQIRWSTLR